MNSSAKVLALTAAMLAAGTTCGWLMIKWFEFVYTMAKGWPQIVGVIVALAPIYLLVAAGAVVAHRVFERGQVSR